MAKPVTPSDNGRPAAGPAVIRKVRGAEETPRQRLLKKTLPAWVVSGAVHVGMIAALIAADAFMPKSVVPKSEDQLAVVTEDKPDEAAVADLTNPDLGDDPTMTKSEISDRKDDVTVDTKAVPTDSPGVDSDLLKKTDITPAARGHVERPGRRGDRTRRPGDDGAQWRAVRAPVR